MQINNMLQQSTDDINLLIFEKCRLQTFEGKWKTLRGHPYCTPTNFAAAGFFYAGSRAVPDNVKCFACCKQLSHWEKNDDPWEEHKKRGDSCPFVQYKLKDKTTVQDFMQLFYMVKRNILIDTYQNAKELLEEKYTALEKKGSKIR